VRGALAAASALGLLALCALVALAPATSPVARAAISAAAPVPSDAAAPLAWRVRDLPPPARTRRQGRPLGAARVERLRVAPAALSAAGGRVRVRVRVRGASICRFSSSADLGGLSSTRDCASGRAAITVRVPRNRTSARLRYVVYLTVFSPAGAHRTVRRVIVERRARTGTAPRTAASGVHTHGSASDAAPPSGTGARSSGDVAPVITTQPVNQTAAPGAPVTLSAAASGTPSPTVQWQVSADGGVTWTSTPASFSASAADTAREYRAVFTNPAGSTTSDIVTLTVQPVSTTNFSGYIDYAPPGASFTAITATWTVPSVTCQPGETSWAAEWPGIGDVNTVQQDGTETDCDNGTPEYWAWYEMFGDPAVNQGYAVALPGSSYPVAAGDVMTGAVSVSGQIWQLTLTDATQGWNFQTQLASPAGGLSQNSAEWMVEDPDGCQPQCQQLAEYSPVRFTAATATLGGDSEPIAGFPATAMQIEQGANVLAAPGPLDSTGTAFTDSWFGG
jgi:hypothetical protein